MDHFFANLGSEMGGNAAQRKKVSLTLHGGGEPTVEFLTLKEIVAEFYRRAGAVGLRASVSMGTNGAYSDSVRRWIIDNRIAVGTSLDGPSEIQNKLRPFRSGKASYGTVVRNLQALVAKGQRLAVRATITDESVEIMEETIELARQLGLAAVHFEPVTLTGRCASNAVSRPDAERFVQKFLSCFLLGLKHDIDVRYSGMNCFAHCHQRFCSACGQNFCVTPDGNITTCYEVLDSSDPAASLFFVGRIDPIQNRVLWDRSRIDELKQRTADNMEACSRCFLRYQCAGDCLAKSFRHSNRGLYCPDPFRCHINERINTTLIAWLADGLIEPRDPEGPAILSSEPDYA